MVKLIGAFIIFISGVLIGFQRAAQYGDRPKHIRQWIQALHRLETEINYGFTPLAEALRRTSEAIADPTSTLLAHAADKLQCNDGKSTAICWREAVEEGWDHTAMKAAEREMILQLGTTLGISDRSDQMKHIQLAIHQLQTEEMLAKEEQQRYEKMWRTLGALGGALVVILMY